MRCALAEDHPVHGQGLPVVLLRTGVVRLEAQQAPKLLQRTGDIRMWRILTVVLPEQPQPHLHELLRQSELAVVARKSASLCEQGLPLVHFGLAPGPHLATGLGVLRPPEHGLDLDQAQAHSLPVLGFLGLHASQPVLQHRNAGVDLLPPPRAGLHEPVHPQILLVRPLDSGPLYEPDVHQLHQGLSRDTWDAEQQLHGDEVCNQECHDVQ
mmetsp:Transcript_30744/g.89308  ORF Transcript_30744/g.89308 Transcript_30744/m.89308 type:complete len:211 (-) Transcript_30744:1560-2192(-)